MMLNNNVRSGKMRDDATSSLSQSQPSKSLPPRLLRGDEMAEEYAGVDEYIPEQILKVCASACVCVAFVERCITHSFRLARSETKGRYLYDGAPD
jgi:hypothetical protein